MRNKMSVGEWNKLPHYSVIGDATKFYVWINTDNQDCRNSASEWITGMVAFRAYAKLVHFYKKDKKDFIELVKYLHKINNKGNNND